MTSCSPHTEALADRRTGDGPLPFILSTGNEHLCAAGVESVLHAQDLDSAPAQARRYFRERQQGLLVGALPFRHDRAPYLVQPAQTVRGRGAFSWKAARPGARPHALTIAPDPPEAVYMATVAEALRLMNGGSELRKVVLGRRLLVERQELIGVDEILQRLALDATVTTFCVPLPRRTGKRRTLVGATPETLVGKQGAVAWSMPLAGSAKRSQDPAEDRRAAEALMASAKDRLEHALVVESVVERFSPYCAELKWSDVPELTHTATMWHLGTRIEGRLRDAATSSLDLAVALHPTAAVCGTPRDLAASAITDLEPFDREFFTGAVGWCDAAGDGRWLVTIRCAEVEGNQATLFAGAGIVPGSDPQAELRETGAKFQTLLSALSAG